MRLGGLCFFCGGGCRYDADVMQYRQLRRFNVVWDGKRGRIMMMF